MLKKVIFIYLIIIIFTIVYVKNIGIGFSTGHQNESAPTICNCYYYDVYEGGYRTGVPFKGFPYWHTCATLQTTMNFSNLYGCNCSGLASNHFGFYSNLNASVGYVWMDENEDAENSDAQYLACSTHVVVVNSWNSSYEKWSIWECGAGGGDRCAPNEMTLAYFELNQYLAKKF